MSQGSTVTHALHYQRPPPVQPPRRAETGIARCIVVRVVGKKRLVTGKRATSWVAITHTVAQ